MRDSKQIKGQMRKCFTLLNCRNGCPYFEKYGEDKCIVELFDDALEYIELLEERISIMKEAYTKGFTDGQNNILVQT